MGWINNFLDPHNFRRTAASLNDIFGPEPEEKDHGTPEQLAEAKLYGYSRRMYNHLREPNETANLDDIGEDSFVEHRHIPTHEQLMEAAKAGIRPLDYITAMSGRGIGHDSAMKVHGAGVNVGDYVEAANHDMSHDEIMKSKDLRADTKQRFDDMVDARRQGANIKDYGLARADGASHSEALEAHKAGADLWHYGIARQKGASHSEALEVHKAGANLWHYGIARQYGASHSEALEAHKAGADIMAYIAARGNGASHNEAMGSLQKPSRN